MEQSANEINQKYHCGDNENGNEEATTSKADFNDSIRNACNTNDSKSLDFNSADDVRQAMKAIMADESSRNQQEGNFSVQQNVIDDKIGNDSKLHVQINEEKKIENVRGRKHDGSKGVKKRKSAVTKSKGSLQTRKRPAKPSKPKPAKRFRTVCIQGIYWGRRPNIVFSKRVCRSASSSEDSFFL